jgi:hypothetical protein
MKLVINETYVDRRAKIGQYASLASLVILAGALILSFIRTPTTFTLPLILVGVMGVGVILSFIGGFYVERFGGRRAHHLGVQDALKGLDDRFTLFEYVLPAPHVLLGPDGLKVILVRSQSGEVIYEDGRWIHKQRGRFFRELAGQERLGRPERDLEKQVEAMEGVLAERVPGEEVPVEGVILFANPEVQLEVDDAPVPAFYTKKIKSWLRGPGMGKYLPDGLRRKVEEALTPESG